MPTFDYENLIDREVAIVEGYGIHNLEDRPWVEFELLERRTERREADAHNKEMEQTINNMQQFESE